MRLAALILLSAAARAAVTSSHEQDVEREILDANKMWFDAYIHGDADAMDQIETDDFVIIQDGRLVDKAEQLARIRQREGVLDQSHEVELHQIAPAGDAVVVTGFSNGTSGGQEFRLAFSEVWVREGDSWRVKLAHYSTVSE